VKRIILASSSPRRKEILDSFGLKFEIISSSIEEKINEEEGPEEIVMALAFEKAIDVSEKIKDDAIIIAADTIVFYRDKILGKPINYLDAYKMLKALQGDFHYVYSGLAIVECNSNRKFITFEKTLVKFKELDGVKIEKYIKSGEAWDKAGAYAIQGLGGAFIEYIYGDYYNVVGLPVSKLDDILSKYFNKSLI